MRVGEKCKFVLSENMYALKAGRKYTGIYAGGDRVRYQRFTVIPEEIIPIKKPVVKKEKAPTASDYKTFSDTAFEVAIRYLDDWRSVISGQKFEEYDWNGLQAGHGLSRAFWDTRHTRINCHAITSGENYAMSIGNSQIIMKYWQYVAKQYGQDTVDHMLNYQHEKTKLSVCYMRSDCITQYLFLKKALVEWGKKHNKKRDPDEVIQKRCEKFPKKKTDGIMKVLKIVKGEM